MEQYKGNNIELAGRIENNSNAYSQYFKGNYEQNGSPKGFDLEKLFSDPQGNIEEIYKLSKYYYSKYGIIMRVVNIIRDFGTSGFDLNYPTKDKKVKTVIENFHNKISIDKLLEDMIFEIAISGNCAIYDRGGERIDIYPVTKVEVSPLICGNKPVLLYKNENQFGGTDYSLDRKLQKKLELTYPREVARGIKKGEEKIILDVDNTNFIKVNSSRYEPYGVPFLLTAFDELAHKTILKEAERSTATGIIEKILRIAVGNKDHPPVQQEIDFYNAMFDGKNGSIRATVPYFVNVDWVEPSTDIFGKGKFEQVDQDILNALGVSLTLIRGEGGGNYSEGFIALSGLIKTIDSLRRSIPEVMNELYQKELIRNRMKPEHAPSMTFKPVEIDKTAKLEMVKWLFTTAGLPYEVLYNEAGYDYLSVKLLREQENTENIEDIFQLRNMPFQGNPDENKGGRPEKPLSERKSDKGQSNNSQPRPSDN